MSGKKRILPSCFTWHPCTCTCRVGRWGGGRDKASDKVGLQRLLALLLHHHTADLYAPTNPLRLPDTSPWNECQALSQQLKRFPFLRPKSSFFQLVRYFPALPVAVTAGNEAGVLFFVFTYACTLSIGFVLLCNGVLGSQAANLTFFMLNLNSVLTTFKFEFVFPCINECYFLLPLSHQQYPCPIFRFACRQLLLSVMFVLF